jgi:hypothetical protein
MRLFGAWEWLIGRDLDAELRFHETKDAIGLCTTLAVFAVTQGAAVAALAKDYKGLVVSTYFVLSLVTIWALVIVLRARTRVIPPTLPHNVPWPTVGADGRIEVRGFDRTTIQLGRWAFYLALLLTIVMFVLAILDLLPGQARAPYKGPLATATYNVIDRMPKNEQLLTSVYWRDHVRLDRWIKWMNQALAVPEHSNEMFVWIEQLTPFDKPYATFHAEVSVKPNQGYVISEHVAFLVKDDPIRYRPTYRELAFLPSPQEEAKDSDIVEILMPDPGERLMILMFVDYAKAKPAPKGIKELGVVVTLKP